MEPKTDFFNINPDIPPEESLDEKFARERAEWGTKIVDMSKKMKQIFDIPLLMVDIYTERQTCIEYYHYLMSILHKLNREYNARYTERNDFWSFKSQIRYPNETAKNYKIATELADLVLKRETINNHCKFLDKTAATIDNLIYAIPRRVEIEQISRGK